MLQGIAFYVFSAVIIASSLMVISARNPVHSVLFLILAFFNAAALFVLLGAEFLAMILVVVYVGAVAVLFLFVVMMLDVDFAELKQGALQYLPIGLLIGGIFLAELLLVVGAWAFGPGVPQAITAPISAVLATCVPPQGCRSTPSISSTRTRPSPRGGCTLIVFTSSGRVLLM